MKPERQDSWVRGSSTAATVNDARMGAKMEHCRIAPDGSVMTRNGTIRCTASSIAGATCYGVQMYRDASGTRRFVALLGTSAYLASTIASGPWTSLATGLTAQYTDFAEFRQGAANYLLWANGTDFKAFDGTTVTTPSGAPSGAHYIRPFNDRLWAAVANTNTVYACRVRDFNTWSVTAGGIALQIGGSRPVTGMEVAGPHLLVFKSEETNRIDGFGEQTLVVASGNAGVSQSVGCVNFRTIQVCGDAGVAWVSQRGIEFYSPAKGYAECVSRALDSFFHPTPASVATYPYSANTACFGFAPYSTAHSYYDRRLGEYHLFIRDNLDAQAEVVFVPSTGACYLWPTNQTGSTAAATAWVYTAPPTVATTDFYALSIDGSGYPLLREFGSTDVQASDGTAGFALIGTVRTRNFLFGTPTRKKWGRILRANLRNLTAAQQTVKLRAWSESSGQNDHEITLAVQSQKVGIAKISPRGTDLFGEAELVPGVALDGMEMEANVLVRADGR